MADKEDVLSIPPDPDPSPDEDLKNRGAQPGNDNASKHGVRRFLRRGVLPDGFNQLRKEMTLLEQSLHAAVEKKYKQVSVSHREAISRVIKFEQASRMFLSYLTKEKNLTLAERVQLIEKSNKSLESRGRAMERLKIDEEDDFFSSYYGKRA